MSRLIINRLRPDMVKRGDMLDIDDILEILAIELIGVVPDDEKLSFPQTGRTCCCA